MTAAPLPESYWVVPGRLLAGEYPSARGEGEAREKVGRLRDAGVTVFVDLTEEGESALVPYGPLLDEGIRPERHAIADLDRPPPEQMRGILDAIDAALEQDEVVYLHCYGGLGRTGTVVGCYLVRHGRTGEEALAEIASLRSGLPDPVWPSPETDPQREMVLGWSG
jgi:hypothetical protein